MFSSKKIMMSAGRVVPPTPTPTPTPTPNLPLQIISQPQDLTITHTNYRTYIGHATWSVLDGLGRTSVKWEMSIDGSNWNTIGYSERKDGAISFSSIPREMDGYMFRATSYAYHPFTNLAENLGWPSGWPLGYETLSLDGNSDTSGSAPLHVNIIGPPALDAPCCNDQPEGVKARVQFMKSGEFIYNCSTGSSTGANDIQIMNLTKNLSIGYHTSNVITTGNFSVGVGDIIEVSFLGWIGRFNISLRETSGDSGLVDFLPNGITSRIMTLNVI